MNSPFFGTKKITSKYGKRSITVNGKQVSDFHYGVDFGGIFRVRSIDNGVIIGISRKGRVAKTPTTKTPANYVIIKHKDGFVSKYWHLKSIHPGLRKGTKVVSGQVIGFSGKTGYATGNHLHFALMKGKKYVNPTLYITFPTVSNLLKQKQEKIKNLNIQIQDLRSIHEEKLENLQKEQNELRALYDEELIALKEESEARQQALLEQIQNERELFKTSINGDILVTGIGEELKARGLKARWHSWVDTTFKSNYLRQLFKYTWPAWLFAGITSVIYFADNLQDTQDGFTSVVAGLAVTVGASIVQYLVTNYDKNKDGRVDLTDIAGPVQSQ